MAAVEMSVNINLVHGLNPRAFVDDESTLFNQGFAGGKTGQVAADNMMIRRIEEGVDDAGG